MYVTLKCFEKCFNVCRRPQLFIYANVFEVQIKSTYFPIRLNGIVFMKHQESIYLHNNKQSYP